MCNTFHVVREAVPSPSMGEDHSTSRDLNLAREELGWEDLSISSLETELEQEHCIPQFCKYLLPKNIWKLLSSYSNGFYIKMGWNSTTNPNLICAMWGQ